jgi:uncharacterized protein (DUF433 family)
MGKCTDKIAIANLEVTPIQLEDYFDFHRSDDIRLKGTRVGIETVLYDFIHRSQTPEKIAETYTSINLEQVYATILYYLHNQAAVSAYLENWLEHGNRLSEQQRLHPSPAILRLRQVQAERKAHEHSVSAG